MQYGRYEIRKVSHMKSMSEETECFNLDLYVDGQKFANVGNDGHGGCHRVHPYSPFTWQDIEKVTEEMKEDKFLVNYDFEPFDTAVSTLFSIHNVAKDILKSSKGKVVFLNDGKMYTTGYKGVKTLNEKQMDGLIETVLKQRPEARILNRMDPAEAAILVIEAERTELDAEFATASAPGM